MTRKLTEVTTIEYVVVFYSLLFIHLTINSEIKIMCLSSLCVLIRKIFEIFTIITIDKVLFINPKKEVRI